MLPPNTFLSQGWLIRFVHLPDVWRLEWFVDGGGGSKKKLPAYDGREQASEGANETAKTVDVFDARPTDNDCSISDSGKLSFPRKRPTLARRR